MTTKISKPAVRAIQSDSTVLNYVTRIVVCLVALGAAILSFDALTALALASGIRSEFAWIWAVVIDGFILVATFAAFALKDRGGAKYYAWSTLGLFVTFSILGNAWHAAIAKEAFELPLQIAVIVTAIPPLALFLAIHLLIIMVSPTQEQKLEHKRELDKKERLRKIGEKELEKIEKEALIRELREQAIAEKESVLEPVTIKPHKESTAYNPVTQKTTHMPSKDAQALLKQVEVRPEEIPVEPDTLLSLTSIASEETSNILLTEAQVKIKLAEMSSSGQLLPTGKTVSQWLGKSERTGQNLLKQFKLTM
jgi:hypothetical protein